MTGDVPSEFGDGSTKRPSAAEQWTPPYPIQPRPRSRAWPTIALAAIAAVMAVAALVVALKSSTTLTPAARTYTAAEIDAAQRQLCDTYKLVARAVGVDTNGGDKALARIALTNAAVLLDNAAADPALDANHRDAARALATAYLTETAKSSSEAFTDREFQAALDDVNARDAVMKKACSVG
jgi:hypothetical protein